MPLHCANLLDSRHFALLNGLNMIPSTAKGRCHGKHDGKHAGRGHAHTRPKRSAGPPTEPGYEAIAAIIEHAKQVCAELNAGYHTPERTHELFEELVGHPVDPTFRLNAPFRTDFGRNIEVGRNVYVNWNCLFMDRGGISIGDDTFIAPKVNLITLNHVRDPYNRPTTVSKPIAIGKRVWIGAAAVVTHDVPANAIVADNPARSIGNVRD